MGMSAPKPPKPPKPPPPPPSLGDPDIFKQGFFLRSARNAGFKGTVSGGKSIFKGTAAPTLTAPSILRGS